MMLVPFLRLEVEIHGISRFKDESENHCLLRGWRREERCVVDDKMMRRH